MQKQHLLSVMKLKCEVLVSVTPLCDFPLLGKTNFKDLIKGNYNKPQPDDKTCGNLT